MKIITVMMGLLIIGTCSSCVSSVVVKNCERIGSSNYFECEDEE
jgi:hypothetical protein